MTDRRTFLASAAGLFLTGSAMGALGHNPTRQKSDTLDLNALMQPIQPRSILRDPDWFIWGGGMVRTADGVCHMLFARWPRKEGFNAWVTHSEIAHATSNDPLGSWTVTGSIFERRPGFWDADNLHNPLIQEFDGKYYLYYSGNFGPRNGTKDGWWIHRNNQRLGVAVADHPAGPWKRFDKPLLDRTPGSFDGLLVNSPTVARSRAGQYVMVYKGVSEGPMPFGGKVRMGLATATNPLGPWKKENITLFDHPTEPFPTDDNFIWYQPTGNGEGRFYAIVKDYRGFYTKQARPGSVEKESLVLFTSETGRDWTLAAHPFVSDFHLRWANGSVSDRLHRLDQPQVWLENGKPSVLFLAVKAKDDADDSDISYNIQIKLKS
ncbi:glycoside hydrolase family protein [Spirosoma sp.]|uniref:glycoside hydrolase family protein n=1 Tax=Spirosoma sp. TaxID=1899569 RepID=UPI002605CFB3|nr:glycoside hydrolase family protein [Spirosoma sp.]MCX6216715.1 glycoside hydrolase family protein [Spirosoma sp.]